MTIIFLLTIIIGLIIGFLITIIFLKNKAQQQMQKYKNNYTIHEQTLSITVQNLKNESDLRNNIEKKFLNELKTTHDLNNKLYLMEERLKSLDSYRRKYEEINNTLHEQLKLNHNQELALKELNIRFQEYKLSTKEKEKLFIDNEQRLIIQFENLSNRIFDQNRYKINEQNCLNLNRVLNPFREQLNEFKNQIQNNFSKEEQIKNSLTYEIHNLHQLNTKITQETVNLTKALKGNNKIQGNWGEVILIRALEASGMREGYEFHSQVNIKQPDGRRLQPDIIVHLPYGKDVIIDSKISLTAYERYFNSDNEQNRTTSIHEHIHSLKTHIKSLNKKDYQKLFGINTLDYILMFIPIESAFTIAIEKEPSLLTDAMNSNIMLISPTTLLIALRTINNLWSYEYQNCYAKKIADKAGRLYDKLRLFMDDLNKIGQFLNKADSVYNTAKSKFSEGKGNIISQAESFRLLGVQIKQPIIADEKSSPYSTSAESKINLNQNNNISNITK